MSVARGLSVLLLALVAGCVTPRTEVILVVDTDLRGPTGIDRFLVEVTSPEGEVMTATAMLDDGQPLPRTLGLFWEGGRLGPYRVRVQGNLGGATRVERTARFTFQQNRTLYFRVDLLASCVGRACGAEQSCDASGCRAWDLAEGELMVWTGTPAPLDVDGGVLPGDDGGPPGDGGPIPDGGGGIDATPGVDAGCGDVSTDELNCGTCGHVCDFQNATGECMGGACVIASCSAGFGDCNGMGDDGCEAATTTDTNCGTCGTRCAGSRMCCADAAMTYTCVMPTMGMCP